MDSGRGEKMIGKKTRLSYPRIIFSIIAFVLVSLLVFGSSIYAKNTLNTSELVHFFIPFPAGERIFTRPIVINVEDRGYLKRLFNPGIEGLSTHWLTNIDTRPRRIGMKFTNLNIPVDWEVSGAIPWDPETHTFGKAVEPGESIKDLGVDWLFHFPDEIRSQKTWYDGSLIIFDADTGENLTVIPVKFIKGEVSENTGRPKTP
jgi:hypothetical protein